MPKYIFSTHITIEGIDLDDATWTYDRIKEMTDIVETNCYEIVEVTN